MIETITVGTQQSKKETIKVPDYLIRDIIDGKPYYYKGYKAVLKKQKTRADIMGSSTLKSLLIHVLMKFLFLKVSDKKYLFLTNELGNHLKKGANLSLDLAIYDKTVLTADKINEHYANVPPKVVVEVDVKIDIDNQTEMDYIATKTDKLHQYGTERVLWILTKSQKVIVALPSSSWQIVNWDKDIELIDGHTINIAGFLKAEGVTLQK